jgi:copper transport protein
MRAHRHPREVAVLLLLALFAGLLLPAAAAAHASLQSSLPGDGEVAEQAPDAVELRFSAPVAAGPGTIRVFAPDGSEVQVDPPRPSKGATITQRIRAGGPGTYGVSYRVSSEDGHVINGALSFSVERESEGGGGADASRDAASVPRSLQLAFSTARFVEVLTLLLVAGGGIFACVIAPGWRPRLLVPMLVLLLLACAAGIVLTSAILVGGLAQGTTGTSLRSTLQTPYGLSTSLRAAIAVVAFGPVLLLRRRSGSLPPPARWAMAIVFAGLAASLSITGHAVTTPPTWLRLPLDMVHVVAAAIWLGGLAQLALLAPWAATWLDAIVRFSRIAFASVVVILLTGAYATYAELGTSFADLLESTYGRLVLAKLALYLGTMPLAWNNKDVFVPAIVRRPEDAPRMLRQYVWRELALVVVVVVLTVWLIATPQPT